VIGKKEKKTRPTKEKEKEKEKEEKKKIKKSINLWNAVVLHKKWNSTRAPSSSRTHTRFAPARLFQRCCGRCKWGLQINHLLPW